MRADVLQRVNEAKAQRNAIAVVTDIASGDQSVLEAAESSDHPLGEEIKARLRSGKSGIVESDGRESFIAVHVPPPRLVIIGAVHISQALYPIAQSCGFDVTIIDPRTAFATKERFADVALHADWPEDVFDTVPLDSYTALAAVTHDPKIDDMPLRKALEVGCFYVGALGSRKTHGKRLQRLEDAGVNDALLATIHAPIGLDIGAANPQEIAVAVMGEIITSLRKSGS